MNKNDFYKKVEKLIDPMMVGSLHFIQPFNQWLPKIIQTKFVESSSKQMPYMGFVVEPYSFFLCYEIIDPEKAESLIPKNFKLIKTKIFENDEPKYYCIFGCINAHTSAFWGSRVEFYIIAENTETGLLSWIIVDYDTNTISYDKKSGLRGPNSQSVVTTNHRGEIIIDVRNNRENRNLVCNANIKNGVMNNLDQRLWLEGNLSIGYGRNLSESGDIFSLKFDPDEVEKALHISNSDLQLEQNTWFKGLFANEPSNIVCFPYAQHFVSDSPGAASNLKNRDEMVAAKEAIDFDKIKVLSSRSFQTMFLLSSLITLALTVTFFLLWILK